MVGLQQDETVLVPFHQKVRKALLGFLCGGIFSAQRLLNRLEEDDKRGDTLLSVDQLNDTKLLRADIDCLTGQTDDRRHEMVKTGPLGFLDIAKEIGPLMPAPGIGSLIARYAEESAFKKFEYGNVNRIELHLTNLAALMWPVYSDGKLGVRG
ncbi:hypothetical protein KBA01_24600 [Kozakia baliensis]|nr:hypothetical protein KBA01_24600 [Kozakia baliensis]